MNRPIEARIERLREKILAERRRDIARAVELQAQGDKAKALYHTGLADGRNGMAHELALILDGGESNWLSS